MVGAGDWLRRVIYRGLRIGGMVYGIRAEARFCSVRCVQDHSGCSRAGLCRPAGKLTLLSQPSGTSPSFCHCARRARGSVSAVTPDSRPGLNYSAPSELLLASLRAALSSRRASRECHCALRARGSVSAVTPGLTSGLNYSAPSELLLPNTGF